jgi:hypothetical protein
VDYPVAYPLASATTYHNYRPSSGTGVFSKENPPSECGAPTSSYVFVKTADRITKQGRLYTRVQQWRGYYGGTDDLLYL